MLRSVRRVLPSGSDPWPRVCGLFTSDRLAPASASY